MDNNRPSCWGRLNNPDLLLASATQSGEAASRSNDLMHPHPVRYHPHRMVFGAMAESPVFGLGTHPSSAFATIRRISPLSASIQGGAKDDHAPSFPQISALKKVNHAPGVPPAVPTSKKIDQEPCFLPTSALKEIDNAPVSTPNHTPKEISHAPDFLPTRAFKENEKAPPPVADVPAQSILQDDTVGRSDSILSLQSERSLFSSILLQMIKETENASPSLVAWNSAGTGFKISTEDSEALAAALLHYFSRTFISEMDAVHFLPYPFPVTTFSSLRRSLCFHGFKHNKPDDFWYHPEFRRVDPLSGVRAGSSPNTQTELSVKTTTGPKPRRSTRLKKLALALSASETSESSQGRPFLVPGSFRTLASTPMKTSKATNVSNTEHEGKQCAPIVPPNDATPITSNKSIRLANAEYCEKEFHPLPLATTTASRSAPSPGMELALEMVFQIEPTSADSTKQQPVSNLLSNRLFSPFANTESPICVRSDIAATLSSPMSGTKGLLLDDSMSGDDKPAFMDVSLIQGDEEEGFLLDDTIGDDALVATENDFVDSGSFLSDVANISMADATERNIFDCDNSSLDSDPIHPVVLDNGEYMDDHLFW